MRTTQFIGLKGRATALVKPINKVVGTQTVIKRFNDGREEKVETNIVENQVKRETYGMTYGMFDEEIPLNRYTLPDGTVYQEFVQACPWSSGPMIFLAFQDKDGKPVQESLWTDDEINHY